MRLHELKPALASKKSRKRVGRGIAAGGGKTAGRGTKGQKARAGGNIPLYFEGGQLPLVRRLPHKRGFHNRFKTEYAIVNLNQLASKFDKGANINPETMQQAGLIKSLDRPVKILGDGELSKLLLVSAHRFSKSAAAKIQEAGGKAEVLALVKTAASR